MTRIVYLLGPGHGVGHERDDPGLVHGDGDRPLVLGAVPAQPARDQLPAIGDEVLQQGRVLVVDLDLVVGAELTGLAAAHLLLAAVVAHVGVFFFLFHGHDYSLLRWGVSLLPNTASSKSKPASSSSSPNGRAPAWPVAMASSSGPGTDALAKVSSVTSVAVVATSTLSPVLTE